jgi:hypothetical protein
VFRLTARDSARLEGRFYLKRFDASDTREALEARLATLETISTALQSQPGITPYVVVGSDPVERLLLTREVEGESILSLHRRLARRCGAGPKEVVDAWRGVGLWLATLHWRTLPSVTAGERGAQIAAYTIERLRGWAEHDPGRRELADLATRAVTVAASRCGTDALLTPCHGDVSGFNILVKDTIGLVDFDDARLDLPGLDVSQASLELRNLSRVLRVVPDTSLARQAQAAFVAGYGTSLPDGPPFWLQHFRNLSVFLLTLVRRRHGLSLSRATDELHYRRMVAELTRSIRDVLGSDGTISYWAR